MSSGQTVGAANMSSESIVSRARSYLVAKRYQSALKNATDQSKISSSSMDTKAAKKSRASLQPRQKALSEALSTQPSWRKHGSFSAVVTSGRKTSVRQSIPNVVSTPTPRKAVSRPAFGTNELRNISVIELQRRAAAQPGPSNYDVAGLALPKGGKFSRANPKSHVEWEQYRAKQIPGPADYDCTVQDESAQISGGKFNLSCPKSDVEWKMYRASKIPGPLDYSPKHPRRLSKSGISGGRFNNAHPKSDVEWAEYRAKQIPGPGEYHVRKGFNKSTFNVRKKAEQIKTLNRKCKSGSAGSLSVGKFPLEIWKEYNDVIWT